MAWDSGLEGVHRAVAADVIVTAMVGEVTRLMQRGYTLLFVPTFRP